MKKSNSSNHRLVVIGGGGGVSQIVLGASPYFEHITAVVAVTDTGRSTGVARAIGNIPAPGDLRNTLATLSAEPESLFASLLQYRFQPSPVSQLDGMAFGNLLIAALAQMTGDFAGAIETVRQLVNCPYTVLPVSAANTQLCAMLEDGTIMENELTVRGLQKAPIKQLFLQDSSAPACPVVLDAINQADIVAIGPGSFFTSVLATLLFQGMVEALQQTAAKVVFICNTTTQSGQTDGFRMIDHIRHLAQVVGTETVDRALINRSMDIPDSLIAQYAADGIHVLQPDDSEIAECAALGIHPLVNNYVTLTEERRTLWNKQDTIRHDPEIVGTTLMKVLSEL